MPGYKLQDASSFEGPFSTLSVLVTKSEDLGSFDDTFWKKTQLKSMVGSKTANHWQF